MWGHIFIIGSYFMNRNKIYIYNDSGCVDVETLEFFVKSQFCDGGIEVSKIDAGDIKAGKLGNDVLAFFMPGGRADEYYAKLFVDGNTKIRDYVANGGMYLGICAGAYYACREVRFEEDVDHLKVYGKYGLNLLNCVAKGTLHKELGITRFAKHPSSMAIVDLRGGVKNTTYASLYHGGPFFDEIEGKYETVADYILCDKTYKKENETKHAIVSCDFGRGKVLLSGVHFEVGPKEFGAILPFMKKNQDYLRCFRDMKSKEKKRQKLLCDLIGKVRS